MNEMEIVPSRAFGDGRHETTQMCLKALAVFAPRGSFRMLDVGSGSGILSIAAAKRGGECIGIDIDDEANAIAKENAKRNGVDATFAKEWPSGEFDVVVANILRSVLVDLRSEIVSRLAPRSMLVLSGLVSTDVPEIIASYAPLQGDRRPEIFERGPWRTLVWRSSGR